MDSKKAIGGRLREARDRLGISLQDIASSTRINAKFLATIEEGGTPDVPIIYLRAFIKAFAEHVELNSQEILKEYFTVEPAPPPVEQNPERPRVHLSEPEPPKPQQKSAQSSAQRQVKVLFVISIAMIVTLLLLIIFLRDGRTDRVTQETPFGDIVKEKEPPPAPVVIPADTAATKKVQPKPAMTDSLRLEAVASESVWVHIVIDNAVTREYVLTPKRRLQWKGKTSFLISVGNAGALSLILNGVKLAPIGAPAKPAINVLLTRESLKQVVKDSTKKDTG
jgi:cytoskeletal protein RodZ